VTDIQSITSMACSTYTNIMEERTAYNNLNGATYFHDWTLSKTATGYKVTGVCAEKIDFVTKQVLDPGGKIEWNIVTADLKKQNPKLTGNIGAKKMVLEFRDKNFYDPDCSGYTSNGDGIVSQRTLAQINIGEGLWDILASQRSNIPLVLQEAYWSTEKYILDFNNIKLDYQAVTYVGRPNRAVVSSTGVPNELLVKFGNYLFKEEGDREWSYEYPKANNTFYGPKAPGRILGCSVLIYDSELSQPRFIDVSTCKTLQWKYLNNY
jgi:hypothetical protein